jgi:hypothetical protein
MIWVRRPTNGMSRWVVQGSLYHLIWGRHLHELDRRHHRLKCKRSDMAPVYLLRESIAGRTQSLQKSENARALFHCLDKDA